ncbi:hypothetical protein G9A89_012842 [Geosiphon pyriformis]|nr:hypothetical protein G9A89_012842 [Geosiphon pyriformis]
MAYAPIAKLKKFTGKENNAQAWLNDIIKAIMANNWNDETQIVPKIKHVHYCLLINSGKLKCIVATIVINKDTYRLTATIA